jgi:nicotinamide phosphoribosyltransferase
VASLLEKFDSVAVNEAGFTTLVHTAMIYGDSITVDRAEAILKGLAAKRFSPFNMVFGIGSFTYEYVTRDTYGFAMKATAIRFAGSDQVIPIYKSPVTDTGSKKSARGIPVVVKDDTGRYTMFESVDEQDLADCDLKLVFQDGKQLIRPTFAEIRARARQSTSQEVTHAD